MVCWNTHACWFLTYTFCTCARSVVCGPSLENIKLRRAEEAVEECSMWVYVISIPTTDDGCCIEKKERNFFFFFLSALCSNVPLSVGTMDARSVQAPANDHNTVPEKVKNEWTLYHGEIMAFVLFVLGDLCCGQCVPSCPGWLEHHLLKILRPSWNANEWSESNACLAVRMVMKKVV